MLRRPGALVHMRTPALIVLVILLCVPAHAADRITILTDAFGQTPALHQDWGFAALIEVGGRRILFDTGNDRRKFEENVRALRVDLRRLDFVVISHRHGDHTAGLPFLRTVNPAVKIYAPQDEHFGGPTPASFFRAEPSLPRHMRYFNGKPPQVVPHGSAWGDIPFVQVGATMEVMSGVRIVSAVSDAPGMRDLRELALVVDTASGPVVVVGCSHPGVETLVRAAAIAGPIRLLAGGFHWVTTAEPEIRRMATTLHDDLRVLAIAPGHCTGEVAFRTLQETFGDRYVYAGVGTRIPIAP